MGPNRQSLLSLSHFKHTHRHRHMHCIRIEQFSNNVNQLRCQLSLSRSHSFLVFTVLSSHTIFFLRSSSSELANIWEIPYSLTESNLDSLMLLLANRLICSTAFHHRFATRCVLNEICLYINSSSYCAHCALPHTHTLAFLYRLLAACVHVDEWLCRYAWFFHSLSACVCVHADFPCTYNSYILPHSRPHIAHHRTISECVWWQYTHACMTMPFWWSNTKSSLMLMPSLLLLKILYNESPLLCILCKIEWEIHHKSIMCTWGMSLVILIVAAAVE